MTQIHKNIHNLRHERELSAQALAKRAGISKNYIYRLEEGKHTPTEQTVRKLAKALDVELFELLGVSEAEMHRSALRTRIGRLSGEQIESITRMIDSFLK